MYIKTLRYTIACTYSNIVIHTITYTIVFTKSLLTAIDIIQDAVFGF